MLQGLAQNAGVSAHRESFATLMGRRKMQGVTPAPGINPPQPVAADITIRVTVGAMQHT
jgi:hypothetical protein